jgi:hypothetical protein
MKKNKNVPVNNSQSTDPEFEAKREAVIKDIAGRIEREFHRKRARLEEIKRYTGGKQIVLIINKEIKTS